jgi:hypothetical protein
MSASSPYQSRLFTAIAQQSRRWGKQWSHTLQRGKTAARWGIQALLYPIYLLLQGAQWSAQRLHQAQAQPPPLQAGGETPAPQRVPASEEVRETILTAPKPSPPSLPAWTARSLARVLQPLMVWKHSALAKTAQPLEETALAFPATEVDPSAPALLPFRVTTGLNRAASLVPRTRVQQFLVRVDRAMAILEERPALVMRRFIPWAVEPSPQRQASLNPHGPFGEEAFQIQILIQAAIDYFFGRHSAWKTLPVAPGTAGLGANNGALSGTKPSDLQLPGQGDPLASLTTAGEDATLWLSWSDLFGSFGPTPAVKAGPSQQESETPRTRPSSHQEGGRQWLPLTQTSFPRIPPIPGVSIAGDGTYLEIETEAVFMGYVKHPLQQLLEWLDRGLAWLESRWGLFWRNARSFIEGFLGLPHHP